MADDKPESTTITMGDIRKLVQETVAAVVKTGEETKDRAHEEGAKHTEDKLDRSSNVADIVQEEIKKLKAKDQEETDKKTIQEEIAELKKKTAEKGPVERNRRHRFMGWGE